MEFPDVITGVSTNYLAVLKRYLNHFHSLFFFERELALLVALQGVTGWKGWRGETSIEKTLLAGGQTVDDLRTLRQGLHKT